ncbi:MAG: pyridoxine 5'-phosphate synthase [Candidatus Gastranaerophilaceae bacterium]|jgi:pyridoxine 5-phosphate synthase|nr:pyridoxine 5'-phosphate synthase [bacterium]MEE0495662.1 pyridoxine 5'-phosphate synthase [Cyanobacteriota bacterium]CDE92068.1 pyridoxine 5'-phosphate synthase [Fusobacterium sp. CAG:815]DAA91886.1 MAG TPA: pyridoxine 5'-phosphate synthase [Candidatus Gastranaerophilales bacterium HUM_6]DAA92407.1 MAG TPA: pyridoxine 5'-phosphate synthase [Candidatus Gastranaerophilales bacterium HUM_7]DAA99714.1 MAG TPA: pyridoxine 5'-phosphate synthase [Candidatus Gastranaerophilales bacterium HUM_12]DA
MLLGVNIDHVATLRNARGGVDPDPIQAAEICEKSGATSITTHLREDRRHIKDQDVKTLKKILKTNLNLEMAVTDEMQKIALSVKPHSVCLVPEKRQEVTTEGGLDVASRLNRITEFVQPLLDAGILVSLFIDPSKEQVYAAAKTGAQFIELHTGQYSMAFGTPDETEEFEKLREASRLAHALGLKVNAGHGLNYENVYRMKQIEDLYELNIGHSIIARSVFVGLEQAVNEMKNLIK